MTAKDRKTSRAAGGPVPKLKHTRLWLFRATALLSPLILAALLEGGLRLAGYGYPTHFFRQVREDGRLWLVENPQFGYRFFPASVARSPQPLRFLAEKPPTTLRVVVLGESAAMGDPEPAYGLARQLEQLLRVRYPSKRVEVLNVAMTAINSHVFREIAEDCTRMQADAWVIYAGNNEVIGPFGAGTVFGQQSASVGLVRAKLLLESTRVGQMVARLTMRAQETEQWQGMELFLDQRLPADDPRLQQTYSAYRQNLEAVVKLGLSSGAAVLLCTMPVNLRDCPPFASLNSRSLSPEQEKEWKERFRKGVKAQEQGEYATAIEEYTNAQQLDSHYAELRFRMGQCELHNQNTGKAREYFKEARDLDALRFRADSRLNGIVKEVAVRHRAVLVETAEALGESPEGGVPGDEMFYDHVHPNFSGNFRVATLLLTALESAVKVKPSAMVSLSPRDMVERLAFTSFDEHRVAEEMLMRLRQPPFTFQSNYKEREERWVSYLRRNQGTPSETRAMYEKAVGATPGDWILHANFARFLEAIEEADSARTHWQEVARLMPHLPDPWFQLGNLAYNEANFSEAGRMFSRALEQKPDSTEALNGLALVYSRKGRDDEAVQLLQKALRINPRFSDSRINLALLLAKKGDESGAATHYQEVLRFETNSVAARLNYANLLSKQGNREAALALYQQAVLLSPEDPLAHYSLGQMFASMGRNAEALSHFEQAVLCSPDFPEARYKLAMELVRAGQMENALPHFAEALRLRPESTEVRFNYGIAQAKLRRLPEAIEEFRKVLQQEPSHAGAKGALERALQLQGSGDY